MNILTTNPLAQGAEELAQSVDPMAAVEGATEAAEAAERSEERRVGKECSHQ